MKKFLPKSLVFAIAVVGCALVGLCLGDWIGYRGALANEPVDAVQHENASLATVTDAGASQQFVQEPGRRTSRRIALPGLGDMNKRANRLMLQAFQDVIAEGVQSTVRLSVRGNQVALGAIVDHDGWIATKASELPSKTQLDQGRRIICRLSSGKEYQARVEAVRHDLDIAILRIDAHNLRAVDWEFDVPARGNWLATTDLFSMPASVGVASAGLQKIERSKAVLGVVLKNSPNGARIERILPTCGAAAAGLLEGDEIFSVNGRNIDSHTSFIRYVKNGYGGQSLDLSVLRGNKEIQISARLMDLSEEILDETEMRVSGQISYRATGFGEALAHDSVLLPNQCGGPIVNLDGKVIGLNIARAGRVSTLALPTQVLQPAIRTLIDQAKLVSTSAVSASSVE